MCLLLSKKKVHRRLISFAGLTLVPKGSFITTADFSLVCDLQGTITTSVTFSDPSGSTPGICFAPPLACGSADGNILERDITKGTVVLNIIRQNIHIPASEGNWSCTDGSVTDHFSVKIYCKYIMIVFFYPNIMSNNTKAMVLQFCFKGHK